MHAGRGSVRAPVADTGSSLVPIAVAKRPSDVTESLTARVAKLRPGGEERVQASLDRLGIAPHVPNTARVPGADSRSLALVTTDAKSRQLPAIMPPPLNPKEPEGNIPGPSDWAIVRAPSLQLQPPNELATDFTKTANEYLASTRSRVAMIQRSMNPKGSRNVVDPLSHWPSAASNALVATSSAPNQAVQAGRAPLAVELEAFVRRELRLLGTASNTIQQAPIYREALSCLCNHFGEYHGLFQQLLGFFDQQSGELRAVYKAHLALQSDYDSIRDRTFQRLTDEQQRHTARETDLLTQLTQTKKSLTSGTNREQALSDTVAQLELNISHLRSELEDSHARCLLFEKGVNEQAERGIALSKRCHKLQHENEALQHIVASLEGKVRSSEFDMMVEQAAHTSRTSRRHSLKARVAKIKAAVTDAMNGDSSVDARSPLEPPTKRSTDSLRGVSEQQARLIEQSAVAVIGTATAGRMVAAQAHMLNEDSTLPDEIDELSNHVIELEEKLKRTTRANLILQQDNKNLTQRVEGLVANMEREQQDMTPRPHWEMVASVLPEFPMSELATSREILEELVTFIKEEAVNSNKDVERKAISNTVRQWLSEEDACESDLIGKHRFFVCKGTGGHVPLYLRAKGLVRNRKMRKGDVEKILSKFWISRKIELSNESSLNAAPLPEHLLNFFTATTGSHRGAIELAYNVFAVCDANHHDPDCAMFLRIFRGELSEFVIFDQIDLLQKLQDAIAAEDRQEKGLVSRFAVHRVLSKMFPAKSRHDMMRLRFALILSAKGTSVVDYKLLFHEDDDGDQTRFVTLVRAQHVEEVVTFTVEVEEALRCVIRDGVINTAEARIAIKRLDPEMPNGTIEHIVAFGCGFTRDQMEERGQFYTTAAEPFLTRLRSGVLLKRHGKKVTEDGDDDGDYDDPTVLDIRQLDAMDEAKNAPESDALEMGRPGQFTSKMETLFKTQQEVMERQRAEQRRRRVNKTISLMQAEAPVKGDDVVQAALLAPASPAAESLTVNPSNV